MWCSLTNSSLHFLFLLALCFVPCSIIHFHFCIWCNMLGSKSLGSGLCTVYLPCHCFNRCSMKNISLHFLIFFAPCCVAYWINMLGGKRLGSGLCTAFYFFHCFNTCSMTNSSLHFLFHFSCCCVVYSMVQLHFCIWCNMLVGKSLGSWLCTA